MTAGQTDHARFGVIRHLVAMILIVPGVLSPAAGQGFVEDFEAYQAGSDVLGQGDWQGIDDLPSQGALVSDALACSGSHAIEIVPGTDLVRACDITGGKWLISMMQYIPSSNTGYTFIVLFNRFTTRDSAGTDMSVQTMFGLAAGNIHTIPKATDSVAVLFDRWIALEYVIDLDRNTCVVYYDHQQVTEGIWDDDNGGTLGAINLASDDGRSVYYDDIRVERYLDALGKARRPDPADETSDVSTDVVLDWTPGAFAAAHDIYLGTDYEAISNADRAHPMGVLVSQGQTTVGFVPANGLAFGQTYYWRIDEVNAPPDGTIIRGDVWTFTTEPSVYPVENIVAASNAPAEEGQGPENTINGSGLDAQGAHSTEPGDMWLAVTNDVESVTIEYAFDRLYKLHEMWVWNYNATFEPILGFGLKDITIEYSTDALTWTMFGDVELTQAPAQAGYQANTIIPLDGIAARHVRLTVVRTWGASTMCGLSEVRFLYIPVHARLPWPADGQTDVPVGATLTWRAGRETASHDVLLSTDETAVSDGTALLATVAQPSCTPALLDFGQRYYWRVDEVNEAEAVSTWEGDIWTFTTQEFGMVDTFESYDDEDNPIFETWIDGWTNQTGATVGYLDAPFAEQSIVHGGRQSMPLHYDNSDAPFYSETQRELNGADWNRGQADTLSLFVRGHAPAFAELPDGTILMNGYGTAFGAGGPEDKDEFRYAYRQLLGDGSITVRVDGLAYTSDLAKAGIMIRESLHRSAKHATAVISPGHELQFRWRQSDTSASANITVGGLPAPRWLRLTRTANTFTAEHSTDGVNWTAIASDSSVNIVMPSQVYIGLVVTSGTGERPTDAEFSGLTLAGDVTDDWQTTGVGANQASGNALAPLYVVLEDHTGHTAVVTHSDPAAVGRSRWHQWQIPFSAFAGLDMAGIDTLTIGVGDRANPTAGGTGTIYIDDMAIGRPLP